MALAIVLALNYIIWRSLGSAGIPATKEPSRLVRQDGKWRGLTLIPWQDRNHSLGTWLWSDLGSVLCWQGSNQCGSARRNGSWAEVENTNVASNFSFQPIAIMNLGDFSTSTLEFLSELGHKLSSYSGEARASSFLFQYLSMWLQDFNSVLLYDTFVTDNIPNQ